MQSFFSGGMRVCDCKRGAGVEEKLKADTPLRLHTPGASRRQTVMPLCPPFAPCCQRRGLAPAFQPALGRQTRALTPRQQGSEQIRGRCSTPFKGLHFLGGGRARRALINIPCVKAADMEG